MPTVKVIRTGTKSDDTLWAQLKKEQVTKLGTVNLTAFVEPHDELDIGTEIEIGSDFDKRIRWEA